MSAELANLIVAQGALPVLVQPALNSGYWPNYAFAPNIGPDFYAYQFPVFSNIAVAGNQTQSITIQNDADFEMREIVYYFNLANAAFTSSARPIPNCTLMLLDTGAGRQLFSNPVPIANIATHGDSTRKPIMWPKIFARNATIQAQVVNFDAAVNTGQLYITLVGRKLFQF